MALVREVNLLINYSPGRLAVAITRTDEPRTGESLIARANPIFGIADMTSRLVIPPSKDLNASIRETSDIFAGAGF